MSLRYFRARDFRNIKDCSIEFSEGVNLLLGENAQGKTNAIEAIYMFARGKSFRKAEDKSLISFGKEGFYTEIGYTDKNGDGTLEYYFSEPIINNDFKGVGPLLKLAANPCPTY